MGQKIIDKIKAKLPVIFMVIIAIYLLALAIKTSSVLYTEIINPQPSAHEVNHQP